MECKIHWDFFPPLGSIATISNDKWKYFYSTVTSAQSSKNATIKMDKKASI